MASLAVASAAETMRRPATQLLWASLLTMLDAPGTLRAQRRKLALVRSALIVVPSLGARPRAPCLTFPCPATH
jgi:hypothetical protein